MVATANKDEIIEHQQSLIQELTRQLESSNRKLSMLQHQVEQLLKRIYGRRSEKMDPNQLIFDGMLDILEQREAPGEQIGIPVPEKKKTLTLRRNGFILAVFPFRNTWSG